jgi:hypothetical protein
VFASVGTIIDERARARSSPKTTRPGPKCGMQPWASRRRESVDARRAREIRRTGCVSQQLRSFR